MFKNTLTIQEKRKIIKTIIIAIGFCIIVIGCILIVNNLKDIKRFFIKLKYFYDAGLLFKREKEVFNIDENIFTYEQAKNVCKTLGAKLATKEQMEEAHHNGANWCNNGWIEKQQAMWPIQKKYIKQIKNTALEGKCGEHGLNGGYQRNKSIPLSVNCYGYKPHFKKDYNNFLDKIIKNTKTDSELIEKYKKMFLNKELHISPFSNSKWSKYSNT